MKVLLSVYCKGAKIYDVVVLLVTDPMNLLKTTQILPL